MVAGWLERNLCRRSASLQIRTRHGDLVDIGPEGAEGHKYRRA